MVRHACLKTLVCVKLEAAGCQVLPKHTSWQSKLLVSASRRIPTVHHPNKPQKLTQGPHGGESVPRKARVLQDFELVAGKGWRCQAGIEPTSESGAGRTQPLLRLGWLDHAREIIVGCKEVQSCKILLCFTTFMTKDRPKVPAT